MKVYRRHVLVCTAEGDGKCSSKGGSELLKKFREEAASLGLEDILITKTGCTGQHATGPTVMIHPDGIWYQHVQASDVREILTEHILKGAIVERLRNPSLSVAPAPTPLSEQPQKTHPATRSE